MLLVTRVDHRRVLAFGVAGLVPAAVVTLLLVHQPSIGDRRLYPLLRGPLTFIGLALASIAIITWATTPARLTRSSMIGLAWAGVTAFVCIGPFLESSPRARVFALDLTSGEVVWTTSDADALPEVPAPADPGSVRIVDGGLDGGSWSLPLAGERVVDVDVVGSHAYAYVVTPGADGPNGATVIAVDIGGGGVRWRAPLPETVAAPASSATIDAGSDAVVVAGGERIAVLDAADGDTRWTESVAELAKSRGYALPGAVQQVTVADSLVYLSTAADS